MNELKVYEVSVGTHTRAGNLNVIYRFVVRSDKNREDVLVYYINKYKGLNCKVEEITEILTDANIITIPKFNSDTHTIDRLKKELEKLRNSKFNAFSGTIRYDRISLEVKLAFEEMARLDKLKEKERDKIVEFTKNKLREAYNVVNINRINLDKFDTSSSEIKFTILLDGNLIYDNNEL